jgi:hypothetical protein
MKVPGSSRRRRLPVWTGYRLTASSLPTFRRARGKGGRCRHFSQHVGRAMAIGEWSREGESAGFMGMTGLLDRVALGPQKCEKEYDRYNCN